MKTIIVSTPVGEFSRKTNSPYTHVVVRKSARAESKWKESWTSGFKYSGVDARWAKDRGYVVSYHFSHASAVAAAKKDYRYDRMATVIGIYEIAA